MLFGQKGFIRSYPNLDLNPIIISKTDVDYVPIDPFTSLHVNVASSFVKEGGMFFSGFRTGQEQRHAKLALSLTSDMKRSKKR